MADPHKLNLLVKTGVGSLMCDYAISVSLISLGLKEGPFYGPTEINRKGDAASWADMFAEGGIFMPQDQPEVTTRQLLASAQRYWDKVDSNITITPVEIEVFGDWAFSRTTIQGTETPKSGRDPVQMNWKEIAIFRRQSDGAWKLWRLIGKKN